MATTKRFALDGCVHDLDTYSGRVGHFFDMVDPRNALLSAEEITSAQALLAGEKAGRARPAGVTDAALWEAKKKVQSAIHPDTGETIPLPFRMSMFMPTNLPITAGMLLSGTGMAQVFWQWLNQSYNAGFNYSNRNASVPINTTALLMSYGVATGVACGMSYGLGKGVDALQKRVGGVPGAPQPLSLRLLLRGLPWMAVASAGVANAMAMRYKEGIDGITVYDAPSGGNPVGTSVAAGRACLTSVALTRAALPVPILLLPPFILDGIRATPLGAIMARSTPARLAVELSVFAVFLQCALPFAVALFPQTGAIAAGDVEPHIRAAASIDASTGKPRSVFYYNKGI